MIKLHDVSLSYGQNTAEPVLHHVNLTVAKGELVLVCGESGCGKSSLLRLINGVAHTFCDAQISGRCCWTTKTSLMPTHTTSPNA